MCKIISCVLLLLLGVCSFCDCKKKQIPMVYLIAMTCVVLLSFFCRDIHTVSKLSGLAIGILFFVISRLTKEAIGYGDSWVILNLGIWLGAYRLIQVIFWSGFAAGLYALFLLWKRRWTRKESIPFIPFLTIAYLGVLLI